MKNEPIHVLFICSMNQWRSPTAEKLYRKDTRFSVRSAGTSAKARRHVGEREIQWADVVIVMESKHRQRLRANHAEAMQYQEVHVLGIEDNYQYMDLELIDELQGAIDPILQDMIER